MRSNLQVDDRRGSDANLGSYLLALAIVAGRFSSAQHRGSPQRRERIRIERVDQILFGGNKNHLVRRALDHEFCDIKRLSVHKAPHAQKTDLSEIVCIHVCRSKQRFAEIFTGPGVVVMVCKNVYLRIRHPWRAVWSRIGRAGRAGLARFQEVRDQTRYFGMLGHIR